MRTIEDNKSCGFRPLKLYREDLDVLLTYFQECCERTTIQDDHFAYDSLQEMCDKTGGRPGYLKIVGSSPYASLTLGAERIWGFLRSDKNGLYVSLDGGDGERLFFKIREYLQTRQRIIRPLFSFIGFVFVGGVSVGLVLLLSDVKSLSRIRNVGLALQNVLFFGYLAGFWYFQFRGASFISLLPKRANASFWARNRDDIARDLLKVGFGGLLGWLLSHFLK